MATRQYIGARYVIKIYENSQNPDSAEWEQGNYEPLVMVTWMNGSYLSKKTVPATVGNPADNGEYWVQTGFYNGQIASLQAQIDDINNNKIPAITSEIEELMETSSISSKNDSGVIFIADSYGVDVSVGGDSWTTLLSNKYPNATFLIEGGTSFASDEYITNNWLSMLTTYVATLTDDKKNKVTQIIVAGGANDGNLINNGTITESVLANKISAFCSYVKTNLPNAIIKCAFIGWFRTFDHHAAYLKAIEVYKSANEPNYAYYSAGEAIMRNNGFIESVNNIHPTVEASTYLASFISSMVSDGDYQFIYETDATMTNPHSPVTEVDSLSHIFSRFVDKCNNVLFLGNQQSTFFRVILGTDGTGYTIEPGSWLILGHTNGTQIGTSNPYLSQTIRCICYAASVTLIGTYDFVITIQDSQVILKYIGNETISNVRTMFIPWTGLQLMSR